MAIISTRKKVPEVVKQVKRLLETYNSMVRLKEEIYESFHQSTYDLLQWCDKYKYDYSKAMEIIMNSYDLENQFWKALDYETKKMR